MRGARDITNYDKSKQDGYAPLYLSATLVRVKCFGGAVLGGNSQSWVGFVRLLGWELSVYLDGNCPSNWVGIVRLIGWELSV